MGHAAALVKDPDAVLDYSVDWSAWLDGDSITASAWTVPEGLVLLQDPAPTHAAGKATAWLSGGTPGITYQVTNRVTTAAGRVDDRSFTIAVQHR